MNVFEYLNEMEIKLMKLARLLKSFQFNSLITISSSCFFFEIFGSKSMDNVLTVTFLTCYLIGIQFVSRSKVKAHFHWHLVTVQHIDSMSLESAKTHSNVKLSILHSFWKRHIRESEIIYLRISENCLYIYMTMTAIQSRFFLNGYWTEADFICLVVSILLSTKLAWNAKI